MNNHILLTFDLEEFDIPNEYGQSLPFEEQIRVANQGMERLNYLLEKYNIKATFFITGLYAQSNPLIVKQIAAKHEIASHSYEHSRFKNDDYQKSKLILEEISQSQVKGFRMPRLGSTDFVELKRCGYYYDSSMNPTWLPGRYNHLSKPRTSYIEQESGLTILPTSVSPFFRFPLFWLSFKNMPLFLYQYFIKRTLSKDKYINLYFHPWEFADIKSYKLPSYIKSLDGERFVSKFEKLLIFLNKSGEFISVSEYLEKKGFC